MRAAWRALVAAAALGGCREAARVEAPAPVFGEDVDVVPEIPPSFVDVPLYYDLGPAIKALESGVPRRFGDATVRRPHPTNTRIHTAFEAEREPFRVSFDSQTVFISSVIKYRGRGWYDPRLAPEVSGSCGFGDVAKGNDDRPRARLGIATTVRLTPDWKLRTRTRVRRVEPLTAERRDQCKVTVFKIDVTDRVMNATRGVLEKQMAVLDQRLSSADVRKSFEHWWHLLERPMRLTDSLYLLINPQSVRVGGVSHADSTLTTTIGLSARPRIVSGPKPPAVETPLPLIESNIVGNGLHMLLEAELDYETASHLLARQVRGKRISSAGQSLKIEDARLMGIGGGRVALELTFSGSTSGRLFLVGTPSYDPVTDRVHVPDLEYDVASENLLVQGISWMKHGDVQAYLRERARWPVKDLMAKAEDRLRRGLNRQLGSAARLEAEVHASEALGVHATRRAILLRARADGAARMVITKAPPLARR